MQVLGACGGNGVILHALKNHLIANVEPRAIFKTPDDVQWKLNFGSIPYIKNLSDRRLVGLSVDVIIGAPDCGHSSILSYSRSKKFGDAKANPSLNLYIESLKLFQPNIFIMENLPALLEQIPIEEWRKDFPNYTVFFIIGPVSKFGNSQVNRVRLLLIGIKNPKQHLKSKFLKFPKEPYLHTTGELLQGLGEEDPSLCHVREDINSIITIYAGRKMQLSEIQNKWRLEFKNDKRWRVYDKKFTTAPGVYKNLPNDYPATARKMNRQFNSAGLMMSPRELARIQGVPDSFKLWYDKTRHQFCINKARATVTKCPSYQIGTWLKRRLTNIFEI